MAERSTKPYLIRAYGELVGGVVAEIQQDFAVLHVLCRHPRLGIDLDRQRCPAKC